MKIIQVIFSLCSGGAEKFVVDLSNQLSIMGHEVEVCMLLATDNEKFLFNRRFLNSQIHFHSMGWSNGFSLSKARQLEKHILDVQPNVVHCHLNVIPYIYRIARMNKNIKFIHTLHSLAEKTCGGYLQKRVNYYFYSHKYIQPICISDRCKKSYYDFYKLNNAPFINNGRSRMVASPLFETVKKEVNSLKGTENTKVFIHVARFDKQKNQQLLIDAFNYLDKKDVDFLLLIIGNGYYSNEGMKLQSKSCRKIVFLGEKANVADYLLSSDAFCISSICEGLPISLIEALSCGLTPICTPVGGIPDVIKNGINGYLSIDLSIEGYVRSIMNFLDRPIDKDTLVSNYMEEYSIQQCAKKYEEIYRGNFGC